MSRVLACSLALMLSPAAGAGEGGPVRVALVFDDGPDPAVTPRLLRVLAEAEVRVSFSYLGRQVEAHPALARAAVAAGHEINNHSFSHPHLRELGDAAVERELGRASLAVQWATGRNPAWFWAPYLETDERIDRLARDAVKLEHFPYRRYHFISTGDWDAAGTDAAAIRRNAVTGVTDGTIILFHEWRTETLAEMPGILAELRRQGCEFVTLTQLAVATAVAPRPTAPPPAPAASRLSEAASLWSAPADQPAACWRATGSSGG